MNINYDNIKETYGDEIIEEINNNIDMVKDNINYLVKLNFTDIESIFERYTLLFLYNEEEFKEKINNLINKCGTNYVDIIESDLSLLEELM